MPTQSIRYQKIVQFKQNFQAACPNYAYELLLLQIKMQQSINQQKPILQDISRIMQMYMMAVEILQCTSDSRFKYFNQKIHTLMMKKNIVEQLHHTTGRLIDQKTLQQICKAQMGIKKQEHQMQIYIQQQQADMRKIQQILKKSQSQVNNYQGRIRNQLTSQQKQLQARINSRKKRSQAGSLSKFKTSPSSNILISKLSTPKQRQKDVRMQYFDDTDDYNMRNTNNANTLNRKYNRSNEKLPNLTSRNKFTTLKKDA